MSSYISLLTSIHKTMYLRFLEARLERANCIGLRTFIFGSILWAFVRGSSIQPPSAFYSIMIFSLFLYTEDILNSHESEVMNDTGEVIRNARLMIGKNCPYIRLIFIAV